MLDPFTSTESSPASPVDKKNNTYEVADIFRKYGEKYLQTHNMPYSHQEIMKDIIICRTELLGGHKQQCERCKLDWYTWNSCGNRHCPKCQAMKKEKWLQERKNEILPVPYFHNIFTLPHEINAVALHNQKVIYDILFDSVAETLHSFGKNNLSGKLGFICTLHTWDQKMLYHLHIHCIIAGGALSFEKDKWFNSKKDYLFDVHDLSKVFQGKFIEKLQKLYSTNKLNFEGTIAEEGTKEGFQNLIDILWSKNWVVHSKKPVSPDIVLDYLGRYVHRVAISNNRIVKVENDKVTFLYRDNSEGGLKPLTIDVEEFIRRFFLHALPENFYRIRYYGFLSTRNSKKDLAKCRELLGLSSELPELEKVSVKDFILKHTGIDITICPHCKKGKAKTIDEIEKISDLTLEDVFQFSLWDP